MEAGPSLKVVPRCAAGKNLSDKVLSGALVSDADFSNATMNNVGAAWVTAWKHCCAATCNAGRFVCPLAHWCVAWQICVPPGLSQQLTTAAGVRAGDSH